jgi:geranylgeranyl reductase
MVRSAEWWLNGSFSQVDAFVVPGAGLSSLPSTTRSSIDSAATPRTRAGRTAPSMAVKFEAARKMRVAVVGGGPSGSCAAEVFAQEPNMDTYLFERKLDNIKPCGGAIPLCMIDEFQIPSEKIDRKVRKMIMISPTGKEVPIGQTLGPEEYIGMTRREVIDGFLRERAEKYGAKCINGLVTKIDLPADDSPTAPYTLHYSNYDGKKTGTPESLECDIVVGGDGANSRVAKAIDAGEYNYAIAFQERIRITDEQMSFYNELAEMYVGADVSPDFYGWVFPKYDHVGVGTGTVMNRPDIKKYQNAIRARCEDKISGGSIIKVLAAASHQPSKGVKRHFRGP